MSMPLAECDSAHMSSESNPLPVSDNHTALLTIGPPPPLSSNDVASPLISAEVLFTNDRVRVWKAVMEPGEWWGYHKHEYDYVYFYTTPGSCEAYIAGNFAGMGFEGKPYLASWDADLVHYVEVGRTPQGSTPHTVGNTGEQSMTFYTVELLGPSRAAEEQWDVGNETYLKQRGGAAPPSRYVLRGVPPKPRAGDEITTHISPEVIFENDVVRVFKSTLAAGESFTWHRHMHDYLYIYTTPGHMEARILGVDEVLSAPWDTDFVWYNEVGRAGQVPHTIFNAGATSATHYTIELLGPSRSNVETRGEHQQSRDLR